jgi:hypothetical protein
MIGKSIHGSPDRKSELKKESPSKKKKKGSKERPRTARGRGTEEYWRT